MSEQTPNSSEGIRGGEPSMEDILASIRKIISDDEPVAMESPEDAPTVDLVETSAAAGLDDMMRGIQLDSNDLTSDAVLDAADSLPDSFAGEGESSDLNIDDVLAGLDDDLLVSDADNVAFNDVQVSNDVQDDALSAVLDNGGAIADSGDTFDSSEIIPDAEDDILSFLDADIPLSGDAAVETEPEISELAADDDVKVDSLLDEILMSPLEPEHATDDDVFDDVFDEGLIDDDVLADTTSSEVSDLDLVKSLMADLADDPSELDSKEDLDELLAIPEVEEEGESDDELLAFLDDAEVSEVDTLEAEAASEPEAEEDILGDILDMTLEDELQSHPDDLEIEEFTSLDAVLDAEMDNLTDNIELDEELLAEDSFVDDLPSLSEIAAAAEADAVAVETNHAAQAVSATAGIAAAFGGAALGAKALGATSTDAAPPTNETETETETETAEIYSEPTIETISITQETSMPVKAVKTDAILDEVTETATAGAFAELNQVVEDKAVFNESGPRIGDLVQDALRPMLKEWLDANLKGIVERAVTKEVKRISSGK